jgi:hypothetical protein
MLSPNMLIPSLNFFFYFPKARLGSSVWYNLSSYRLVCSRFQEESSYLNKEVQEALFRTSTFLFCQDMSDKRHSSVFTHRCNGHNPNITELLLMNGNDVCYLKGDSGPFCSSLSESLVPCCSADP